MGLIVRRWRWMTAIKRMASMYQQHRLNRTVRLLLSMIELCPNLFAFYFILCVSFEYISGLFDFRVFVSSASFASSFGLVQWLGKYRLRR